MAKRKSYSQATQDSRGNWWATDPEGNRVAVDAPSQDWETGDTVYNQWNTSGEADNPYLGISQARLGNEAARWQPGQAVSNDEFGQFYQSLAAPGALKDFGGLTPQQYLQDPRSIFRSENGQIVYRPEQQQGEFQPVPQDHSFLGNLKGFLTSPGVAMTLAPLTAGALGQMGMIGNVAGTMGSSAFPTFGGEAAAGLGAGAGGGAAAGGAFAPQALPDSYWNMLAGEAPSGGISSLGGPGVDFAAAGNYANPWAAAADPMTQALTTQMPGAVDLGKNLMNLGLTQEGFLGALQGTGSVIPGAMGPMAVTSAGQTGPALANLASSSQYLPAVQAGASGTPNILQQIWKGLSTPLGTALGGLGGDKSTEGQGPSMGSILGALGGTALGYLGPGGARDQQQAAENIANKYLSFGDPYRTSLAQLNQNPSSFYEDPIFKGALQQGSDALARSLSAKVGNPILNPSALQNMQDYTTRGSLDAFNNRWNQLASAGQLGVSQASPLSMNAIGQMGQANQTLGAGLQTAMGNGTDYGRMAQQILRGLGLGSMLGG